MMFCVHISVPAEGMRKLMSLVKAQQEAWMERQKAEEHSVSAGRGGEHGGEREENNEEITSGLQQVSLSFSTLSTR